MKDTIPGNSATGPMLLPPSMDQGTNSIMAAAIGLSTLGAPSPPSERPSVMNIKGTLSPIESKPEIQSGKFSVPPAGDRNSTNKRIAVSQQYAPFERLHPSAFHPSSTIAGGFDFGAILRSSVPYSDIGSRVQSATVMSMDRFLLADRVNAMNRAFLLASHHQSPSLYYPTCPGDIGCDGTSSRHVPDPDPFTVTSAVTSSKSFPETLFDVISAKEYSPIIAWLPHGQGFVIHDKQLFSMMILDRHFAGAKFTSFTRRLKRWNFVRVPRGPELGAYYNPKFKKDQPELMQKMIYRKEVGDDTDVDNEEGHNIEEGIGVDDANNDEKNPLKKANESPISLPSTPPKRPRASNSDPSLESSRKKSSPVCDILNRPRKAAKNDVLNPERRVDSRTASSANAEDRMEPLPSTLPKRPSKNSKMSLPDSTLGNHLCGYMSEANTSFMPRGAVNDRYKLLLKLRQEVLEGSMTPGFLNSVTLSGSSWPKRKNEIERAERSKLILEAERVLGTNRFSSDFLSSSLVDNKISSDFLSRSSADTSSETTASLPTFYQCSDDVRANPMLRSTSPSRGGTCLIPPSHRRGELNITELPLSYLQTRLAELQSSKALWYNARQEAARRLSADILLSGAREHSRSVLMTPMEEATYEIYLREKNYMYSGVDRSSFKGP